MPLVNRLYFIDYARTYAVLLVLLAHSFATTELLIPLGSDQFYVLQFIRIATPMFVFMFGFMLEFVYVRKAAIGGNYAVRSRLHIRAFQCYFAFALTSFCAFVGGYSKFSRFIGSLVFFNGSRFGNILKVYTVLLILAPILIHLRIRYWTMFFCAAYLLLSISFYLTSTFKQVDFGVLNVYAPAAGLRL